MGGRSGDGVAELSEAVEGIQQELSLTTGQVQVVNRVARNLLRFRRGAVKAGDVGKLPAVSTVYIAPIVMDESKLIMLILGQSFAFHVIPVALNAGRFVEIIIDRNVIILRFGGLDDIIVQLLG